MHTSKRATGRPPARPNDYFTMKIIKVIVAGVLIVSASSAFAGATAIEQQVANQVYQLLKQDNGLRVDREAEKAWINPILWVGMDAQQKETTTRMIAIYLSA